MKNEIHINGLQSGVNTVVIREGHALPLQPPRKLVIAGNIETVTAYLAARINSKIEKGLQVINRDTAVITIDEENLTIKLELDPNDPDGTEVTGKLDYTPEFLQFKLNTGQQFTREALVKLLRFNRSFFPNVDRYEEMLKAYMAFQVKTETEVKAANDNRGNKSSSIDKTVNTYGLPLDFILSIPIFKGNGIETFRAEICIETTDAGARFWFESTELAELIERRKKEIFENLTKDYTDYVIVRK